MFLNSGKAIAEKIQALINEEIAEPVRLAVAFWGAGADYTLRGTCHIICDLESGACNPAVIRTFRKRDNCVVLKHSKLHAKVVISSAGAVISSANMSTNGLGAEGADASGTIEAGYFVPAKSSDYKEIVIWFDDIWTNATEITNSDLFKAQEKWNFRNREMPITPPAISEVDIPCFKIDPISLLKEQRDPRYQLYAVRPEVLSFSVRALPNVEPTQVGKIAMWACHLIINRTGDVLQYSDEKGGKSGPATDQWIVSRLKKGKMLADVVTLLHAISRDSFFSAEIRRAANHVLLVQPWMVDELPYSQE